MPQIALTRLFSVVQYYHGAFLAISLALFGFALSGVFVVSRPERFARERLDEALARYGLGFALAIPASFYTYLYGGLDAWVRGSGARMAGEGRWTQQPERSGRGS